MNRLVDRFSAFAAAYKKEYRYKLWNLVGLNHGSEIRTFFVPYREWDASHVIATEVQKTRDVLNTFDEVLAIENRDSAEDLALISLAAKNRAELMSAKSDFYPVFTALIGLGLAVWAIFIHDLWPKMLLGAGGFVFAATGALIRTHTREQVAYLKELTNLIEHRVKYPRQK
ncbi:hypothetical protein [Lysobacter sp. CA196]|uniref:hypothetical protein n=1 Tax=Lysobacter sp. CA196 TaxID=3455606 RepID=UPI003F8D6406